MAAIWPNRVLASSGPNQPRVNIAQFYLFAFVIAWLWGPVWVGRLVELWPRRLPLVLLRPAACAALVAAIGALEMNFRNPHPWNSDPNYLHDWFLLRLHGSIGLRYFVSTCIVVALPLAAVQVWNAPQRRVLLAVWAVSTLYLLPHGLVDHRYYIVPTLMLNFFTRYSSAQARWQAAWQLALAAAACAYLAVYGGPHSGL